MADFILYPFESLSSVPKLLNVPKTTKEKVALNKKNKKLEHYDILKRSRTNLPS